MAEDSIHWAASNATRAKPATGVSKYRGTRNWGERAVTLGAYNAAIGSFVPFWIWTKHLGHQPRRAILSRLWTSATVTATAAARGVSCGAPKYFANKV